MSTGLSVSTKRPLISSLAYKSYETNDAPEVSVYTQNSEVVAQEPENLKKYITLVLYDDRQLQDSSCRKITRTALQLIAMAIVAGARVGMTMICISGSAVILNTKISNPYTLTMGIINAVCAVFAYGGFSAFAKLKIIEVITKFTAPIEEQLMSDTTSCFHRTAIKTAALIIGFTSQIPMGYAAYESALFSPYVVGLLTFLDGGRASYSTYMSLKAIKCQCHHLELSDMENKLAQSRKTLTAKIAEFQNNLLEMDESSLPNVDLNYFSQDVLTTSTTTQRQANNSIWDKFKQNPATEIFVILMTAAVLAEFYALGHAGGKALTKNRGVAIFSGTVVTLANGHLWYNLVKKVSFYTVKFFRGTLPLSLSRKLMPKFHNRFTTVSKYLAIPTFVPSVLFAKLYYHNPVFFYPIAVLASIAAILGGLASLHGLRDMMIGKYKSDEEIVKINRKLERIKSTIGQTNLKGIASFVANLPEGVRNGITDLPLEDLQSYLQHA